MPLFVARAIHFGWMLLLTGLFWLSAGHAWKRRRRHGMALTLFMGFAIGLLLVLWFFLYPPIHWVIAGGRSTCRGSLD